MSTGLAITLGDDTTTVYPTFDLAHGDTEALLPCSNITTAYEGTFSLTCENGTLIEDVGSCTGASCSISTVQVAFTISTDYSGNVTTEEEVASGGTTDAMCEDVDSGLSGVLTLTCEAGTLTANASDCTEAPCEIWDFGAGTIDSVSGLVYPLAQIAVGDTGVGSCSDANEEYSGNVTLTCTAGDVVVTDVSDCKLTCTVARSATTVSIDGTDYTAGPAERMDDGATSFEDCTVAVSGYTGTVEMSCSDGVLTIGTVDCTPDPCDTSTILNLTLADVDGSTTPVLAIEHNGEGLGECSEVNPLFGGFLNMSCFAGALTLVSTEGCTESCNTSVGLTVELEGYSYEVFPDFLLTDGASANVSCPAGFNGTLQLNCGSGNLSASHYSCDPDPCIANETFVFVDLDGVNGTYNGSNLSTFTDIPHDATWTIPCSDVHPYYSYDIEMVCNAGQVYANASGCSPPCPVGSQDSVELSGQIATITSSILLVQDGTFDTACSTVNSLFTNNFTTTCSWGTLSSDMSTCNEGCPAAQTTNLAVTGGSFTVTLDAQLDHGSSTFVDCSSELSASYTGTINLTCTEGTLAATSNCSAACTGSVTLQLEGVDYTLQPTAELEHDGQENVSCPVGYNGTATLECDDSTTFVYSHTCDAQPCDIASEATISLDGSDYTVNPTSTIAHEDTQLVDCSDASADYSGRITLECFAGSPVVDANTCNLICKVGDTVAATVGGNSATATLTENVDHAGTSDINCPDVVTGYSGTVTVLCTDGVLSVTSNTCAADPCVVADSITVTIGGSSGTTYPNADVSSGSSGTADCNTANSMYTGDFQIDCLAGAITVPSNALDDCKQSCTTAQSVQATLDASEGVEATVMPSALVEHGNQAFRACSDFDADYAGLITLSCDDGTLQLDSVQCNTRGCATYDGTEVDNLATWTVGCSDIHAGLSGDITFECLAGYVNRSAAACTAASCLSEGAASSLDCTVLGTTFSGSGVSLVCSGGSTTVDISGCAQDCSTFVISDEFATKAGTFEVNPLALIADSAEEVQNCSDLSDSLTGVVTLSCMDGFVNATESCTLECDVSTSVSYTLPVAGRSVQINPDADFNHGSTQDINCSSLDSRFDGVVTLDCTDGVLGVESSTCYPLACPVGTSITLSLGAGDDMIVTLSVALEHSNMTTHPCDGVEEDHRGNITLTCDYGSLVADTTSCSLSTTSTSSSTSSSSSTTSSTTSSSSSTSISSSSTSSSTSISTTSSTTSTTTSVSSTTLSTSSTSTSSSTTSTSTSPTTASTTSTTTSSSSSTTSTTSSTSASTKTTTSTSQTTRVSSSSTSTSESSTTLSTTSTSTTLSTSSSSTSSSRTSETSTTLSTTSTVSSLSSLSSTSSQSSQLSLTSTTSTSTSNTMSTTSSSTTSTASSVSSRSSARTGVSSSSTSTTTSLTSSTSVTSSSRTTPTSTSTSVTSGSSTSTSTTISTTSTATTTSSKSSSSSPSSAFSFTSSSSTSTSNTQSTSSTSSSKTSETTASTSSTSSSSTATSATSLTSTSFSTSSTVSSASTTSTTESSTSTTITTESSTSTTGSTSSTSTSSLSPNCVAGQDVSVELNGTTYTITIEAELQSGYSSLVECSALDAFYINFVVVTCSNEVLTADSSACEVSETETVISSTVSLELTSNAETTEAELEEALNTEESQAALLASLAESLGIDPARITIVSVTVTAAARLLQEASAAQVRQLTATSASFNVELDYEVATDTTINDTSTLQESMTAIGESGSNESTTFSTALVVNLEAAANATSNTTSSVLTSVVETAKEQGGITVAAVTAPTIITREITTSTTTDPNFSIASPDSGGDSAGASAGVVIIIILLVIAVLVAVAAFGFVAYRRGAFGMGNKAASQESPAPADEAPGADQEEGLTSGAQPTHVVWSADDLRTMNGPAAQPDGQTDVSRVDREGVAYSSV